MGSKGRKSIKKPKQKKGKLEKKQAEEKKK
jgi:hypothetical protein